MVSKLASRLRSILEICTIFMPLNSINAFGEWYRGGLPFATEHAACSGRNSRSIAAVASFSETTRTEIEAAMDFEYSAKVKTLSTRLRAFMDECVYPNEQRYEEEVQTGDRWQPTTLVEEMKQKARAAGLWNLFLPDSRYGAGLANLEYAPLCEIMGRVEWAAEVFNCSAPDSGNMETLERYGTEAQKREWLEPLLDGAIRSCFAMTEPAVASSDATNIESRIERQGDHYVVNGRKWWATGGPDRRCKLFIFM